VVVNFHPAALEELRQARRWYEERSPVSALGLAQEIDRAVLQISEAPARYPRAEYGTRRFLLARFPFTLFYRASESEIVVVAVAHQKRRPGYWASR
jgi:plasmid stabilization system protein ParE